LDGWNWLTETLVAVLVVLVVIGTALLLLAFVQSDGSDDE